MSISLSMTGIIWPSGRNWHKIRCCVFKVFQYIIAFLHVNHGSICKYIHSPRDTACYRIRCYGDTGLLLVCQTESSESSKYIPMLTSEWSKARRVHIATENWSRIKHPLGFSQTLIQLYYKWACMRATSWVHWQRWDSLTFKVYNDRRGFESRTLGFYYKLFFFKELYFLLVFIKKKKKKKKKKHYGSFVALLMQPVSFIWRHDQADTI